jgi:hypothetical protein
MHFSCKSRAKPMQANPRKTNTNPMQIVEYASTYVCRIQCESSAHLVKIFASSISRQSYANHTQILANPLRMLHKSCVHPMQNLSKSYAHSVKAYAQFTKSHAKRMQILSKSLINVCKSYATRMQVLLQVLAHLMNILCRS